MPRTVFSTDVYPNATPQAIPATHQRSCSELCTGRMCLVLRVHNVTRTTIFPVIYPRKLNSYFTFIQTLMQSVLDLYQYTKCSEGWGLQLGNLSGKKRLSNPHPPMVQVPLSEALNPNTVCSSGGVQYPEISDLIHFRGIYYKNCVPLCVN